MSDLGEKMARGLITPSEQMALTEEWIASGLEHIEKAKLLLTNQNPDEVKRGLVIISNNYSTLTKDSYCIGQIKWRLGFSDPSDDLERAVKLFALMLHDCRKFGVEVDTYWAHMVAFISFILSGSIPAWVAECQTDLSSYLHRKKRLLPWEINLGYQSALALALYEGKLPECWPRFITDSTDRSGLKRIRQNIVTYERLFMAAKNRSWTELVNAVKEVDSNYKKRGSSESSYADVFGDGPYNGQSIDYIAAAILRTVQKEEHFPLDQITTPHIWKWGGRDISKISPLLIL